MHCDRVLQLARRYWIGLTTDLLLTYTLCMLCKLDWCTFPVNVLSVLAEESERNILRR
jgi:hypothetical protein